MSCPICPNNSQLIKFDKKSTNNADYKKNDSIFCSNCGIWIRSLINSKKCQKCIYFINNFF